LVTEAEIDRIRPFFPKSHGRPRVDDRRVLSGIIFVNRNGLRWCNAPSVYSPPKTLYNRWKRWCERGVFARIMEGLASDAAEQKTVMIDATYLKAHRTASSLAVKEGARSDVRSVMTFFSRLFSSSSAFSLLISSDSRPPYSFFQLKYVA
jgi:transposase